MTPEERDRANRRADIPLWQVALITMAAGAVIFAAAVGFVKLFM